MTAPLFFRSLFVLAALFGAAPAHASPGLAGPGALEARAATERQDEAASWPQYAQADCSAAASQAAAQTGGQVLSVQASNQGGQTVCVVTVLIPGEGGERPRRTTITIPG